MRSISIKLAAAMLVLLVIASLAACTKAAPSTSPAAAQPSAQLSGTAAKPGPSGSATAKPGGTAPQANASPTPQTPTVRGSGIVSVTAYANLYFGTAGQIAKINVKQGDRVTKGTALAILDTTSLEASLAQAKVNLDQSRLARIQANSALASAQLILDKTKVVGEIKDSITNAQWTIKAAQVALDQAKASNDISGMSVMTTYISNAQKELDAQTKKLRTLLATEPYSGLVTYDIYQTYDRLTVDDARMKQLAVDSAQATLDKSQDTINQMQKNLDVIQLQLTQATIVAPFDGLVATVNGNEGDMLPAPSQSQKPLIYLIDPSTMQIIIGVNELDVPKVKIGQKASVNIDAFPGTKIEGQVTAISPSPTVTGGIVDYGVTIAFKVPAGMEARVGMNGSAGIAVN